MIVTSANPPSTRQQPFVFSMPLIHPLNDDGAKDLPESVRKKETIEQRFNRFHSRNPHVYEAIVAICKGLKQANVHEFGMKGIFERMRWEYAIRTQGEKYKLNNIFTSYYSRMVMDREPGFAGFFETRKLLSR